MFISPNFRQSAEAAIHGLLGFIPNVGAVLWRDWGFKDDKVTSLVESVEIDAFPIGRFAVAVRGIKTHRAALQDTWVLPFNIYPELPPFKPL